MMVDGRQVPPKVSFDVNPSSRQILENLIAMGHSGRDSSEPGDGLIRPAATAASAWGRRRPTGKISMRTVPRNFPGRSGTKDDLVYLCSPETATASALTGVITDPAHARYAVSEVR